MNTLIFSKSGQTEHSDSIRAKVPIWRSQVHEHFAGSLLLYLFPPPITEFLNTGYQYDPEPKLYFAPVQIRTRNIDQHPTLTPLKGHIGKARRAALAFFLLHWRSQGSIAPVCILNSG